MFLRAPIRCAVRAGSFCLVLTVIARAQHERPQNINTARAQIEAGELASADLTLESIVQKNPLDAEAWLELGSLQARLRNFTQAELSLRRSVALRPGNARAHYTLGLLLVANPREKLDWPGAIAEFQTAVQLQPDYSEALTYLGAGLTATGKQSEAVAVLQKAVAAGTENATAFFNLGLGSEAVGRDGEAAQAYEKAIQLRKTYPEASSALGKLKERTGDSAAAEQQFRAALRENPDLQDAHQALGRVLRATHRTAQAQVEFALAAAIGQREPDAVSASQLSNAALKQAGDGHLAEAAAMLRRAVLLRPDSGVAHNNLGLLLADLGDREGSIRELSIALSLLPAQGRPYFDLGRVLLLEDRLAEAGSCLRWAAQFQPVDPRIAIELRKIPRRLLVEPLVRPSFGAKAELPQSHVAFAAELHRQGDFAGEAGELLHALSLSPGSIPVRLQLAQAFRRLNEPQKAALENDKVLLIDPNNAEALRFETNSNQPDKVKLN